MAVVAPGDRVQILTASRFDDGTSLESAATSATPYWICAGGATGAKRVGEAVIGMAVSERKSIVFAPSSRSSRSANPASRRSDGPKPEWVM